MTRKTDRAVRMDCKTQDLNIETVCAGIAAGHFMTAIAKECGVSIAVLADWIEADPERAARAREIRSRTAGVWDDLAATGLADAKDPFELAKAKELAHHYRWRASKIAPKTYGERVQQEISGPGGAAIEIKYDLSRLSDSKVEQLCNLIDEAKEQP